MASLREQLAMQGITLPEEPQVPTAAPPPMPVPGSGPFGLPIPANANEPVRLSTLPNPANLSIGGGGLGPSATAPVDLGKNLDLGLLRPKSNLQRDLEAVRPAANVDATPSLVPYRPATPGLRGAVAGGTGGGFAWRVSPEARKAQEAAFKAQEGATTSVEQRLRDQAVTEQGRAFEHEQSAAQDVEAARAAEAERKAKATALLADYDAAEKDAAATKIDAGRYWASKPSAQKVLSIIGATLGGFAAGLKGGPNHALDQLNREIERDVDEQKANLANKHASADAKRSLFAANLQAWGNEDAAHAATMAQKTAQVQAEMQRQAAESKSVEAQNQADMLGAQLAQQKAAFLEHAMGAVQAGPAGGGLTPAQADKDLKFLAEQEQKIGAPETREALNRARASTPLKGDIPGVGPVASWMQEHAPTIHGALYGKDAERREQDWNLAKNQAIKALSGSGVSGAEMERMRLQFDGARDAQSRRRALDNMSSLLNSQVANIEAAVNPASVELFNQRQGLRQQMAAPAPAAPPASFKGAGR